MLTITNHTVNLIKDPFKILTGERYEFILELDVPEDDELYFENGLNARVIYTVEETRTGIVKYELHERTSGNYVEFDLEDDELELVDTFCKEHLSS
ncbi:pullulanase [Paenibacillus macquariensis subsp. defensor]|nr:pullulanase [Paenibacillus macquariensis subsp. defensor]